MDSTSIFNIILGNQPKICNSLTVPKIQSNSDQGVVLPPVINERSNYEYTITTPNFPFNYPTNIQCITLIKAPSFDYQIILEVRQIFDIEPSKNCLRDFLEITDGPYGFSKRIGKFCNTETPPKEIRSTGSFLWLRFRSDNTIPHRGFQIAYRFIRSIIPKSERNYCYKQTIIPPGDSFNFNTSFLLAKLKDYAKVQDNTSIPLECVFDFYVSQDFRTYAYTTEFIKPNYPVPCSANKMDIYHKNTFNYDIKYPHKLNYFQICEEDDFSKHLFKYSTRTTVRIITKDLEKLNAISIILTSVKIIKDKCPFDYFLCSSKPQFCISKKLTCNNEPNCPNKIDENCFMDALLPPGVKKNMTTTYDPIASKKAIIKAEETKNQERTNKIHAMILGSIALILIISMIFCLLLTIHSKKNEKNAGNVSVVDIPTCNQDNSHNKNIFYELLQSSEPSVTALSPDKLNRKMNSNDQIWSKRPNNDVSISNYTKYNNINFKLNGGIKTENSIISNVNHPFKTKVDTVKGSSLNKIGKYLSVPNPAKIETVVKPIIPNKSYYENQPFNVTSPSEDFQSWSSNSFTKQNSITNRSVHHIQRASSMGSGLRKKLQEQINKNNVSKNVEWYFGPVFKDENVLQNSSEILNKYSTESSKHVPGCRSLPNFCNTELQNSISFIKPVSSETHQTFTDSLDCSADDNSSYRENQPSFYVSKPCQKTNIYKNPADYGSNNKESSHYGFRYFCAHNPMSKNDFIEYIA